MNSTVLIETEAETALKAVLVAGRTPFRSKTDSCMVSDCRKG